MGNVANSSDPNWPSAASLLKARPVEGRRNVGLVGVHTYASSVTPRSATSTPDAIREALGRYSTWSSSDGVDLAEHVAVVDYGNVVDPDLEGGGARVADALASFDDALALSIVLGGDNAATWHAMRAVCAGDYSKYGLITLDAHLDMRDGSSNGSPVRQLIDDGLDGHHVVQVGIADFSNSAFYAKRAHDAGVTVISRDRVSHDSVEEAARRAVAIASRGGRRVYVDIDLDAADRSVVPGCPAAAPGGFSADEMRRFVRTIANHSVVSVLDLTEVDVERDSSDGRTVRLAALLVLEALAGVRRRIA
jgi:formiminoglutamase